MPKDIKSIYRVIDANINRAKEGLRVCEDYARFVLNDRHLTHGLKSIRHNLGALIAKFSLNKCILLKERNIRHDIGKKILGAELNRKGIDEVFYANIQRIKESVRVLEEFSKVIKVELALRFKDIRYRVYEIEKKAVKKIAHMRHIR